MPLDQVTLGGVSIPAARLAAVMREVASVRTTSRRARCGAPPAARTIT
ncbi:MAG: hypothetical protein M5U28_22270 [Sandaracinaceae bacterium]|nr:hypothetical protein [Sandaracinaceae bacterium]